MVLSRSTSRRVAGATVTATTVAVVITVSALVAALVAVTPVEGYAIGSPLGGGVASRLASRATTCNGDSSLCTRKYSNVTFAGAHNSYGINSPGQTSAAANQNVSIARQLDAGTRMLQVQAHKSDNSSATGAGIDLCHSSCTLFQGGSLEYFLGQVKDWTDQHTSEVVTLLIVNSDGLPATQFAQAFQSTGLADRMWTPSDGNYNLTRTEWPTLGSMVDSGKTVVGFLATGADLQNVDYLLDEFVNMWENPYDQTSTPFNCSIDRIGETVSDPTSIMYVSNQFLDKDFAGIFTTPDVDAIGTTNSLDTTLSTSDACAAAHQTYPNFILTDYSTTPDYDVQRAVAQMNGVSYTPPAGSDADSSSAAAALAHQPPANMGMALVALSAAALSFTALL